MHHNKLNEGDRGCAGAVVEFQSNNGISQMIAKCTDAHCIEVAETIARNKEMGMATDTLEELLKNKISQMTLNTRILNGMHFKHKPK